MAKVGIIGSGNVGANIAFFAAERNVGDVILYDVKEGLSTGKALDMMEAASIRNGTAIINGRYMAHSSMWAIIGRMATYTGKAITWEQAMASKEDLSPASYQWDAQPPVLPDKDGTYPIATPGVTRFF